MKEIINRFKEVVSKKYLTAQTAHNLTKYGKSYENEELVEKLIENIEATIANRASDGHYTLVFELDESLSEINEQVLNHFKELEFTCLLLNNKVHKDIKNTSIYINWK